MFRNVPKCSMSPGFIDAPRSAGFAELIFISLIWISALVLNLGITWHSPRGELSRLGEPKCLFEEKLSCLPGLPYLPRRDNMSFPPRRIRDPK